MIVKRGKARVIKNSRGEKTVEVVIYTNGGKFVSSAPSGKSKGANEVADYNKYGIKWSVKLANSFLNQIRNKNFLLKGIDDLKVVESYVSIFEKAFGALGGNVIYAIESCFLKAAAKENKVELWQFVFNSMNYSGISLPTPVGNCIGGGLHSRGVGGKKPDFQEFLLISNEKRFEKAVGKNISAYFYAESLLRKRFSTKRINDEGALETNFSNEQILDILKVVAEKFNLRIGVDVAASTFFDKKRFYDYKNKSILRDRNEQIEYIAHLVKKYNLFYVEDALDEEDFLGFAHLSSLLKGRDVLIVGDDLTTTNFRRIQRAVRAGAINSVIIKPNQIGSFVKVKEAVEFCKKNNLKIIFSHRSGETMDSALADFAVGFQADFVKTGIYGRERAIKLRRIIEIEKEICGRR